MPSSPVERVPESGEAPRVRRDGVPARALALIAVVGSAIVLAVIGTVYVVGVSAPSFTSSRPAVSFSSFETAPDGFGFEVEEVSESRAASNFRVNLRVNDTVGFTLPLAPVMPFTLDGTTYTVAWTDEDDEGRLTTGDRFDVRMPGGVAPQTTYTVLLLWKDGNLIQSAPWPSP